jgi:2-dehydropantoate 2-reductase
MEPVTILGAGSVGLALAAWLGRAGGSVRLITRTRQQAQRLRDGGLLSVDPALGAAWRTRPEALAFEDLAPGPESPLVLALRIGVTGRIVPRLEDLGAPAVLNLQNGMEGEDAFAGRLPGSAGAIWRQTCRRVGLAQVWQRSRPRLILGREGPPLKDDWLPAFVTRLQQAGLDAALSADLAADRRLKLCVNLLSAPNAIVRRNDQHRPAFARLKLELLEECAVVLAAAGLSARSCDGRDPSLDEMIALQRRRVEHPEAPPRATGLVNSVWRALESGAELEPLRYHRSVLAWARAAGVAAPLNRALLDWLLEVDRLRPRPGSLPLDALPIPPGN